MTGLRALVVDDEADLRMLVSYVLGGVGFDVVTVESGVDALAMLEDKTQVPDLIVLDVQMPDLDGWDTLAVLRSRPHTRDVPVMMCTVRSQPKDSDRATALGCDAFVRKPFAIDHLAAEALALVGGDRA